MNIYGPNFRYLEMFCPKWQKGTVKISFWWVSYYELIHIHKRTEFLHLWFFHLEYCLILLEARRNDLMDRPIFLCFKESWVHWTFFLSSRRNLSRNTRIPLPGQKLKTQLEAQFLLCHDIWSSIICLLCGSSIPEK